MRPFPDSARLMSRPSTLKSKSIVLSKSVTNGRRNLKRHKRSITLRKKNWTKSFNRWKAFDFSDENACNPFSVHDVLTILPLDKAVDITPFLYLINFFIANRQITLLQLEKVISRIRQTYHVINPPRACACLCKRVLLRILNFILLFP